MNVIRGINNIKIPYAYPVLAIGNFDGVHLGHQAIFKKVVDRAEEVDGTRIVLTFDPHPRKIIATEKNTHLLSTFEQKVEFIKKTGIDTLICADFTPDFAAQSPREFTENILVEKINVKEVFVGHDFNFGKGGKGTVDSFQKMGEEFGFKVEVLNPVKINGSIVSSSFIRDLIANGQVSKAAGYLGRLYSLEGVVVGGFKVGSSMGFPTANIELPDTLIPQTGVYAVRVVVKNKSFNGVTNIGYNPTFKRNHLSIEVYVIDFTENLYEKTVRLSFIEKVRDEIAFSSPEKLKIQIQKDILAAKELLKRKMH